METINQDTLICFVLDKSGSMVNVTTATCEGFNQFKTGQKENPGETLMTLTLFDSTFDTRFVGAPLDTLPDLGLEGNLYTPSGWTALFDAVGDSIKRTEEWIAENQWMGRVMVVTLTDGDENSSSSWHIKNPRIDGDAFDLAGLIEWKQNEGWDFVFMGAGGTDWLEKTFLSVPKDSFYAYSGDAGSTRQAYATMDCAMTSSRTRGVSLNTALADTVKEQTP